MADKKAAASTNTARTRTRVQTITITPEQAMNFLNRITNALESVEHTIVPRDAQYSLREPKSATNQSIGANVTGQPPKMAGLEDMIIAVRNSAIGLKDITGEFRSRLYSEPNGPNADGGATASRGNTKDAVGQTHDLLISIQQDVHAIIDYITS